MQTDRNLLLGVLAFQDEYIDLAQLAAICRAWTADKSRSIPQLLIERQWLSEQGRDELERKVERKLKRFVGDVHATLGAVADGAVRDVLKQVHDPDISESLSSWPDSGHVLDRRATDKQPFYTTKLVQVRTLRDAITMYDEQRKVGCAGTRELWQ